MCCEVIYFTIFNKIIQTQIQYVNDNGPRVRDNPQIKSDRDMHVRRKDIHICILSLLKCLMHLHLHAIIEEYFYNA
jgi:hypothetical protein